MSRQKAKMEFRYYQMPADSPVLALLGQKWVQNYGRDIDYLHFHNYLEIGYCYAGKGSMILGEDEVRFSGREYTVLPKNYPHTTNSDSGDVSKWEYLFIDVEGFLGEVFQNSPKKAELITQRVYARPIIQKSKENPIVADAILRIMNIMRNPGDFYMEEVKSNLMILLVNLARMNREEEMIPVEREKVGRITDIVSQALDSITLHYTEQIKVEDLAKWCHLSETHFRRVFTEQMKMSPMEYLNLVRIQAACDYLKTTDEQISDIATKCGFFSLSTFNRNFKELTGFSPHEWRKRPENYEQQLLKFRIHAEEGW